MTVVVEDSNAPPVGQGRDEASAGTAAEQADWKRRQAALFPLTGNEDVFGSLPKPERALSVEEMHDAVMAEAARRWREETADRESGRDGDHPSREE